LGEIRKNVGATRLLKRNLKKNPSTIYLYFCKYGIQLRALGPTQNLLTKDSIFGREARIDMDGFINAQPPGP